MNLIERPVIGHGQGAIGSLLGRLEQAADSAPWRTRRESLRDRQPDRDMPVVSAGVHSSLLDGSIGNIVGLLDREAVHIGPNQNNALSGPKIGRDTRFSNARPRRQTCLAETFRDQGGRPMLRESELGMTVEVASGLDEAAPLLVGNGSKNRFRPKGHLGDYRKWGR
jgi:hypothetical protein